MIAPQTAYQYWRHRVSGATYAVRFEGDQVTGFFGPVVGDDIHPDDLPLYPYFDADSEPVAWAREHAAEFLPME